MKHIVAKGIYYDALYYALKDNFWDLMERHLSIAWQDYLMYHPEWTLDEIDDNREQFYSLFSEFHKGTLEMLRKISDAGISCEDDEMYK